MGAAILSYGFITLGAIASGAIILRERALKQRTRSLLTDRLPSISTTEKAEIFGLTVAEIVLGLAILFGIGAEYAASGTFFQVTHKSVLTLITFVVIGVLLWLHLQKGIRGRLVARVGLTVYLLISLGYPGVKFVGDVLLFKADPLITRLNGQTNSPLLIPINHQWGDVGDFVTALLPGVHLAAKTLERLDEEVMHVVGMNPPGHGAFHLLPQLFDVGCVHPLPHQSPLREEVLQVALINSSIDLQLKLGLHIRALVVANGIHQQFTQ